MKNLIIEKKHDGTICQIDKEIVEQLTLPQLFKNMVKTLNIVTLMFENTEGKSAGLFLIRSSKDEIFGGSVDHCPLSDNNGNQVGMFHYHNGTVFHYEVNNIPFPINIWEKEYIKMFNEKYGTSYKIA